RSVADGGRFLLVDIHPLSLVFHQASQANSDLVVARSYFTDGAPDEEPVNAGVARSPLYTWRHSLGDVMTSLAQAGLRGPAMREHPYTFWRQFPALRPDGNGWWRWPDDAPQVPLLYSIVAVQ